MSKPLCVRGGCRATQAKSVHNCPHPRFEHPNVNLVLRPRENCSARSQEESHGSSAADVPEADFWPMSLRVRPGAQDEEAGSGDSGRTSRAGRYESRVRTMPCRIEVAAVKRDQRARGFENRVRLIRQRLTAGVRKPRCKPMGGARKQPVMKRRVPRKLRRGAGGQAGQIWVMPPSTTSSMPVI